VANGGGGGARELGEERVEALMRGAERQKYHWGVEEGVGGKGRGEGGGSEVRRERDAKVTY